MRGRGGASGSSSATAARPPCSRSVRPRPTSSCATRSRSARTTRCSSPSTDAPAARIGTRRPPRGRWSEAIAALEAEAGGPFDLILFGNESADAGGFQVGIRVARALGRPIVNGIKAHRRGRQQHRRPAREGDGRRRGLPAPRPGRAGREGGHQPAALPHAARAPAVEEGRRASARGPPGPGRPADAAASSLPTEEVSETVILGTGADAAPAVVDLLQELGLRVSDPAGPVVVLVEHDRGVLAETALQALTLRTRAAPQTSEGARSTPS